MAIDVDQMMIDELKRRWPDMSEDERARWGAAILPDMRRMAAEIERTMAQMWNESGAFERFKSGLDALAKAVKAMPSVKA